MFNIFNFKIAEDQDMKPVEKGLQAHTVPFLVLLGLILLVPLFFLPASVASLATAKLFLVYILTIVALFIWVLMRLRDQSFSLPFNLLGLSVAIIPFLYVLAGVFSKSPHISFFARDFALDSVVTIVVLFLLLVLAAIQFNDKSRVVYAYLILFVSFFVVAIVHLLNILIPVFPSFGVLFNSISTTLGKWNDLALFSILMVALSMMTLLLIRLTKNARILVYTALGLGLVLTVIINFTLAWYILGSFSLLFFIYMIVGTNRDDRSAVVPFLPLSVFLLSFLFLVAGGNIGNSIASVLNITHFEVRPSWPSTLEVIKESVASRPILGSGPSLFEVEWLLHKPQAVMLTQFWNLDFRYGVGFIPSFFVTTGILGALSWIFFFVLFLISGFKTLFKNRSDSISRYLFLSSFSLATMLWAILFLYLPSAPLVVLAFVMTGIYLGLLYQEGSFKVKTVNLESEPKFGFLYITVLVLILIGTIALGYQTASRFAGHVYFQNSLQEISVGTDIAAAERSISNAINLERNDTYLRVLAELGTARISGVLNDTSTPQDLLVDQFRTYLAGTIESYQAAIKYDPLNYNNYIGLANLYRDLMALNVQGSYEQAQTLYNQALTLKVNGPDIYLHLARLEAMNENNDKAKEYIDKALSIKPNYVDAVFLFSQIEVSEGNIDEAIAAIESASIIQPNDPTILFQLGLLRYNADNFARAVSAFEQALSINPQFQNAKYFLGLSYDKVGNSAGAIAQFTDLVALNPGNQEVAFILENLQAGLDPFANVEPPLDETPEAREDLPLDEGDLTEVEGDTAEVGSDTE